VFKCLDCHKEIASRLNAHSRLHSSYGPRPGSSQGSVKCHSDHNGLDFPLIQWDIKTFDHKQTGYALEGKHPRCNTGTPRKLGVPGEELPKVMYRLIEADHCVNQKILVVGGGDSAVESAMGLGN